MGCQVACVVTMARRICSLHGIWSKHVVLPADHTSEEGEGLLIHVVLAIFPMQTQECAQHTHRASLGRCHFRVWWEVEGILQRLRGLGWARRGQQHSYMASTPPLPPCHQCGCPVLGWLLEQPRFDHSWGT